MRRQLGLLVGYTLAFWALAALGAWQLGGDVELVRSFAAMLLCLVPGAAMMALAAKAMRRSADEQLLAVLGGTGVRLAVGLGGGWLAYALVEPLQGFSFWIWLLVFYMLTLGLEVYFVVRANEQASVSESIASKP